MFADISVAMLLKEHCYCIGFLRLFQLADAIVSIVRLFESAILQIRSCEVETSSGQWCSHQSFRNSWSIFWKLILSVISFWISWGSFFSRNSQWLWQCHCNHPTCESGIPKQKSHVIFLVYGDRFANDNWLPYRLCVLFNTLSIHVQTSVDQALYRMWTYLV